VYYRDSDEDGYGDPLNTEVGCSAPVGYVSNDEDCDDTDSDIHPNQVELCNNIDDNCNTLIDEDLPTDIYFEDADSDSAGNPNSYLEACAVPEGYVANNNDCDDTVHGMLVGDMCALSADGCHPYFDLEC